MIYPLNLDIIPHGDYIYLIQERESIRCFDNIYKIGKTKQQPHKRMEGYPKDSLLYITIVVDDCDKAELDLIHEFKIKFTQETKQGKEYFRGNPIEMIKCIVDYQYKHFSLKKCRMITHLMIT